MSELQTLISQIDVLPLEDLDEIKKHVDECRTQMLRSRDLDAKRQTQEAIRIRQEVNSEIDQALESARRFHQVAKV